VCSKHTKEKIGPIDGVCYNSYDDNCWECSKHIHKRICDIGDDAITKGHIHGLVIKGNTIAVPDGSGTNLNF
jgi:hypothetical protein